MKNKLLKGIAIGLPLLASSAANAGLIISAESAIADSNLNNRTTIGNTIDQSGLSSKYQSGVDDFDDYLALNPTHSHLSTDNEWFSKILASNQSVIYDLGKLFTLNAVALWVEESFAPHTNVSFNVSSDGVNYSSVLNNIDLPNHVNATNYEATRFDFSAVTARYFSIDFGKCASEWGCSLGEVAFSASTPSTSQSSVPEPSTLAIFSAALLGFFGVRRQQG